MINKIIVITSIMHKRCNDSMKIVNELLENELKDIESNIYDINKEPIIAEKYNISLVPSMILFDDGEYICKISGNVGKENIIEIIKDINNGKYNWSMWKDEKRKD